MTTISASDVEKNNSNFELFQQRRDLRSSIRRLVLERWHYIFLWRFFQRHKKVFLSLLLVLLVQVFLEIGLFVYGHYVGGYLNAQLNRQLALKLFGLLLLGATVYLAAAFIYLWLEKSLLVKLINQLREHWFKTALYRQTNNITSFEKARLLAKLTYHFSLVQAGFSAAFSGVLRWTINNVILLVFSFFINPIVLTQVLISIPVGVAIAVIGYVIGKYYLSREASLSTAIITHISQALDKVGLIQNQAREKETLAELEKLVVLDSRLKIRRNIWLEFGFRIIFIAIILGTAFVTYIVLFTPQINIESLLPPKTLISGIVFVYLTRQLYLSLRAGLYFVPFKIGLILSLPEPSLSFVRKNIITIKESIVFYSRKVKLTPNNQYLYKIQLSLAIGGRYLICGQGQVGKTALARVLSANAGATGKPWLVRVDGKRRRYPAWRKFYRQSFYAPVSSLGSATIGEVIAGCDGMSMDSQKVEAVAKLTNIPALDFIKRLPKYISTPADSAAITATESQLLQLANCLFVRPQLIVIDNAIMDKADERVIEMVKLIADELKNSIIVCVASEEINYIKFNKKYVLESNALSEK